MYARTAATRAGARGGVSWAAASAAASTTETAIHVRRALGAIGCASLLEHCPSTAIGRARPPLHNGRMRILEIREATTPIASPIRNAYIDFAKMTTSLVAVVTDALRDGRRVIG